MPPLPEQRDELEELVSGARPRPRRYFVQRSKNTGRFVLYDWDSREGVYRRRGDSFTYRALVARVERLSRRALQGDESELFDALFGARIEFDPSRGKRPRGVQAAPGRRGLIQLKYAAAWGYLWAKAERKKKQPGEHYGQVVKDLARREVWTEDLPGVEKSALVSAALVLSAFPDEWKRAGLQDPLAPDENLGRPGTFYRKFILPTLSEISRRATPEMLAGRSHHIRRLLGQRDV